MTFRGHYQMARGWMDHPVFANEPMTEREAWQSLIEEAAYKDRPFRIGRRVVHCKRGQLAASERFLAEKWGWTKSKVHRFLNKLKTEAMIEAASEPDFTVITITNYNEYQLSPDYSEPHTEPQSGPPADQQRTTSGPAADQNRIQIIPDEYPFSGKVVRLNAKDYGALKARYHGIADFDAMLGRCDDEFSTGPPPKKWFVALNQKLNYAHQRALQTKTESKPNGKQRDDSASRTGAIARAFEKRYRPGEGESGADGPEGAGGEVEPDAGSMAKAG